ncbi:B3 domain-containing transcription factor VRN1-like [Malania oleifera]|uniref:B3 domain-containing transcription factor VRN1-like n=1 Tax=Malania oleifera TaxID=397392 RepID=UPI0025ADDE1E|nr:B3 domain-containing transcription factor VRN1-like [Malania oleifera]
MPPPSCGDGDRSNLPAGETFNFFKIIRPTDIRDGKLRLPPKFVRKYGKKLSNPVLVKVPNGSVWKVELMKCDGGVWLQNGWREFSKYYSIGQGHLLIFKYEGFSRFLVIICDMTASEIEYPFSETSHKDSDNVVELGAHVEIVENDASVEILGEFPMCQKSHCEESIVVGKLKAPKVKEIEDDLSVEILEDFPTWQKTMGKQPSRFPCSQMIKPESPSETEIASALRNPVMNFQQKDLQANGMKLAGSKRDLDGHKVMQDLAGGHRYVKEEDNGSRDMEWRSPQAKFPEGSRPATVKEELTALPFKPENPFHIVTMRPSYVGVGCSLRIPLRSIEGVFSRKRGEVTLQVSDGRTWPIKYSVRVGGANLGSGWKTFVLDNHLKVGDICVFEQIKGLNNSLKVVMFRACEDGTNCFPTVQKLEI